MRKKTIMWAFLVICPYLNSAFLQVEWLLLPCPSIIIFEKRIYLFLSMLLSSHNSSPCFVGLTRNHGPGESNFVKS